MRDKFNHNNNNKKWIFYFGHFVVCISNLLMVVAVGFYFDRCNLFLWQHRSYIVKLNGQQHGHRHSICTCICLLVLVAGIHSFALPIHTKICVTVGAWDELSRCCVDMRWTKKVAENKISPTKYNFIDLLTVCFASIYRAAFGRACAILSSLHALNCKSRSWLQPIFYSNVSRSTLLCKLTV